MAESNAPFIFRHFLVGPVKDKNEPKDFVTMNSDLFAASDAQMVGEFRKKFKISPPEMNGPPEFQRAIRAQ